jgi:hypothetical protein
MSDLQASKPLSGSHCRWWVRFPSASATCGLALYRAVPVNVPLSNGWVLEDAGSGIRSGRPRHALPVWLFRRAATRAARRTSAPACWRRGPKGWPLRTLRPENREGCLVGTPEYCPRAHGPTIGGTGVKRHLPASQLSAFEAGSALPRAEGGLRAVDDLQLVEDP